MSWLGHRCSGSACQIGRETSLMIRHSDEYIADQSASVDQAYTSFESGAVNSPTLKGRLLDLCCQECLVSMTDGR